MRAWQSDVWVAHGETDGLRPASYIKVLQRKHSVTYTTPLTLDTLGSWDDVYSGDASAVTAGAAGAGGGSGGVSGAGGNGSPPLVLSLILFIFQTFGQHIYYNIGI